MRRLLALVLAILLSSRLAMADEGMWLYNAVPVNKLKAKYNFAPDRKWLDHVRLASGAFGRSASIVSADGLVFTNHHVAANCIHNISTAAHDYMKEGFYAGLREKEPKCPGLEMNTLLDIRDITTEVQGAVKPSMSDTEAGTAQRTVMSKLEGECSAPADNIHCETVTLYAGGLYHLYKHKRYSDIRLVMAPEYDIAFFGGDADNFTFPRYDLDIAFLRIYENNKPIHVEHMNWSTEGVKEGDLVFVSGNPATTGRLLTMAQLEYLRDVAYPARIVALKHSIDSLTAFSAKGPENARVAERLLWSARNSYKGVNGYLLALHDNGIMAAKAAVERELRYAVATNPKTASEFGVAWDGIAQAMQWQRENFRRITYKGDKAIPGTLADIARTLVRVSQERPKAIDQRMRGYQDQDLPAIEQSLFANIPFSRELEIMQVTEGLRALVANLPADDTFLKDVLGGKSPQDRARELVTGSHLSEIAFRRELYNGGEAAIEAASDPMIQLIRKIDPEARQIRSEQDDKVDAEVRKNGALIAKARFQLFGAEFPPDATESLRLSYGQVKGYVENGETIPYYTTIGGAFEREKQHNAEAPYTLPPSWHRAFEAKGAAKLDLTTPFDTVSTADIIGGNSGSPVVDTKGDVVGIIFDGNIHMLPWNFHYEDRRGRSVFVDVRAVLEILRKIYNAGPLVDELLETQPSVLKIKVPKAQ